MRPAGLAAYRARDPARANQYSFEQPKAPRFSAVLRNRFRSNPKAWKFWETQPPGYRRLATFYVMSAKQEPTRERRLARLIRDSAAGRRIGVLQRPEPKPASGPRRSGKARGRGSARMSR